MTKRLFLALVLSVSWSTWCFGLDPRFDYGPGVHVTGRPAQGSAVAVKLDDTGYSADLMISYYADEADKDPDFVTISVTRQGNKGDMVYFMREFPAAKVSEKVLKSQTKDVMVYDASTRTVQFTVDDKVFKYVLPVD